MRIKTLEKWGREKKIKIINDVKIVEESLLETALNIHEGKHGRGGRQKERGNRENKRKIK